MKPVPVPSKSAGFSLVELLVAMVIALVVLAGVVNSFIASKDAFRYNEELGFIQENARFAIDRLSREVREAGYFGCDANSSKIVNVLQGSNVMYKRVGLEGFDNSEANTVFPTAIQSTRRAGTDAVIVRRGDTDNSFVVEQHNGVSAQFEIVGGHNFRPGTILIISDADCQHQGIFQMSGPTNSGGGADNMVHNTGGSTVPGNCAKLLKGTTNGDCSACSNPTNCTWKDTPSTYGPDATLMTMSSNLYYIAPSGIDNTLPALYVTGISGGDGTNVTTTTNEIIAGVVDMQIEYGIDQTASPDGVADRYYDAQSITADEGTAGGTYRAWNRVVAARIQLVMRSRSPILPTNESRTLLGVNYNDRYLYQLISVTVQIRNPYLG